MSNKVSHAKTAKILFDLVGTLDNRVKPLSQWFSDVVVTLEKWFQSEGNQGVKRMKDVLSYGWATILGEHPKPLDFCKSKGGVPILVLPLVRRFAGYPADTRLLSAILTLVRITDLWEGVPEDTAVEKSISVITDTRLPSTAKDEIDRFRAFIPLFLAQYKDSRIAKAFAKAVHLDDGDTFMYRQSRGPNGPLTANAHLDILSLHESKTALGTTLLTEVENLQDLIGKHADYSFGSDREFSQKVLSFAQESDEPISHSPVPGKLSLKPEKGGKIRIIAQPDYVSQVTLRPVHRWLSSVLREFDTDYTYDQGRAIPIICKWQNEGAFVASFDQSACTDRFPFEYQLEVIRAKFGNPVVESLRTVMADRDWLITLPSGKVRTVRWSVGQPLGMYGSWPLMALTHHLLVQYCSWIAHGKTFRKSGPYARYAICGDDIVIADRSVSDSYLRVCKRLGMVINLSKSHLSGKGTGIPPVSEFTKVMVVKGTPLSPIKPRQLESALRDARNAVPLLFDLHASGLWHLRRRFLETWIRRVFPKEKTFLTSLITLPQEFGGLGFRDDRSLTRLVSELHLDQVHPLLYYIATKVTSALKREMKLMSSVESTIGDLPVQIFRIHPLKDYANYLFDQARRMPWVSSGFTVTRVLSDMLVRGLRGFTDIILGVDTDPVGPWEVPDRKVWQEASLWERALSKTHTFRPNPKSKWDSEEMAHQLMSQDPEWLRTTQLQLITSLILGKRSARKGNPA